MERRPRPFIGMVLGLALAAVVVGLLWFTAVLPPSRILVFGLAAALMVAVAGLTTRHVSAARGRFLTVAVLGGVLSGIAVTGAPDLVEHGTSSPGCTLEATAGGLTASPEDTSMWRRFTVTTDEPVAWSASSEGAIAVDTLEAGVRVAGFDVPVRTVTGSGAEASEWSGTVDVAQAVAYIEDKTWLELTGVYELTGVVSGQGGECAFSGYAALAPAGLFATNVLVALWIALGVVLLLIAWAALAVRKSFRDADRADAEIAREEESRAAQAAAVGAAAGASGAGRGDDAQAEEPVADTAAMEQPEARSISPYAPPVRRSTRETPADESEAPAQAEDAPTEVMPMPVEPDPEDDVPEGEPWSHQTEELEDAEQDEERQEPTPEDTDAVVDGDAVDDDAAAEGEPEPEDDTADPDADAEPEPASDHGDEEQPRR